ncbi:MAG: arylsulfatase [Planctomycetaceae bacterium]|nr:arylsulfatase [Planctomycetaceae bacterium]
MFRFATLSIVVILAFNSLAHAADRPNVVLIMIDDLGYGDIACYGTAAVKTPNLDRLAAEGLQFTSGYTAASTCTPTRFATLTGMYAWRQPGTGIAPPNATALIQPGTVTLASIMKQAGYATGIVGKWHLGLGEKPEPRWNGDLNPGPLEIGFDYCFLMPTTGDRVPCVYVENHRVVNLEANDPITVTNTNSDGQPTGITHRHTLKMDWSHGHNQSIVNGISRIGFMTGGHKARWRDEDMGDVFTGKAVDFITKHKAEPFFLFFATHDIHVPRMPHERFQGSSKLGYRGDAIQQMDSCVGKVLDTLDELKLAENTLVVFCSDNGPVLDDGYKDDAIEKIDGHKQAGRYRGGKYGIYEGGTRTPFITRWPGKIKPGVSDEIVCTVDLPGSMAALVGAELPETACPDSFNVLGALTGQEGSQGRDHLVQEGRGLALRVGDWKYLEHPTAKPVQSLTYEKGPGKFELFNLADDPGETTNLIEKQPERAEQMKGRLAAIREAGRSRP